MENDKEAIRKWKTLEKKRALENPFYNITYAKVLTPKGANGHYWYVSDINAALVIAKNDEQKFLLVEQYRYPIGNKKTIEFVVGGCGKSPHVNPEDVAKKELKEEAGIVAQRWTYIGYQHPANGYCSEKVHMFLAEDLEYGDAQQELNEDLQSIWLSEDEITRMIKEGIITDGRTIAAWYKYHLIKSAL